MTDDELNELDRFEIRCRCLPWVIPLIGALKVTGLNPDQLVSPSLPSFLEMMQSIRARIQSWGPAVCLGYNSFSFDEPLLQQAFWQALMPPYLTVTGGYSRLDVLPLVRAAASLTPELLDVPYNEKGKPVFKLDQLAPANGFEHANAHDALGDVEATIHMARILAEGCEPLWKLVLSHSPKVETANALSRSEPVLVF